MHMLTAAVISVIAVVVSSVAAAPERQAAIEKHVQPAIDAMLIPGAMVGIHKDGETSYHAVGSLSFDADAAPGEDTMYEIGSISKVITGTLLADAIWRGEVEENTPLRGLLPEGVAPPRNNTDEPIRLWHLATHTSGWGTLPINIMPTDPDVPFDGYSDEMMLAGIGRTPVVTKPGTEFVYSNFGFGVLGTVLAMHAGGEYEDLVIERVLSPLGIEDFVITLDEEQLQRLAPPTRGAMGTKTWGRRGAIAPAGMWTTTAPQLMKFAIANLPAAKLLYDDLPLIVSMEKARQPRFDIEGMGQIGYAWMIARDGATRWHNGMTGGYSSYMAVNGDLDLAVVMLANGAAIETTAIGEKIMQEMGGMSPEPIAPPIPEKLDDELAAKLVGTYHSLFGFDIEVTVTHGLLFARLTNQTANRMHQTEGEGRFRYDNIDAELGFELPEGGGKATGVTLFQNGREMRCERVGD